MLTKKKNVHRQPNQYTHKLCRFNVRAIYPNIRRQEKNFERRLNQTLLQSSKLDGYFAPSNP